MTGTSGPLTLDDILDLRAYERVRPEFRAHVIALKRHRRVPLGPIMTVVFECVDTVRFQIQEMARAEKIVTDEGIQAELDAYNPLLPTHGELSATLFIELTSEDDLRHWLPRLVGIEGALALELGHRGALEIVHSVPEASHGAVLTREAVTPAVHYLRFVIPEPARILLAQPDSPVWLVSGHPAYEARTELGPDTRAELGKDLGIRPA